MSSILDFLFGKDRKKFEETINLRSDKLTRIFQDKKYSTYEESLQQTFLADIDSIAQIIDYFSKENLTTDNMARFVADIQPKFLAIIKRIESEIEHDPNLKAYNYNLDTAYHRDIIYAYLFRVLQVYKGLVITQRQEGNVNFKLQRATSFLATILDLPKEASRILGLPKEASRHAELFKQEPAAILGFLKQSENSNMLRQLEEAKFNTMMESIEKMPKIYSSLSQHKVSRKLFKKGKHDDDIQNLRVAIKEGTKEKESTEQKIEAALAILEQEFLRVMPEIKYLTHNKKLEISNEFIQTLINKPDDHHYQRILLLWINEIYENNQIPEDKRKFIFATGRLSNIIPPQHAELYADVSFIKNPPNRLLTRLIEMREAYQALEGNRFTKHGKDLDNLIESVRSSKLTNNDIYNAMLAEFLKTAKKSSSHFLNNFGFAIGKGKFVEQHVSFLLKPTELGKHHYARMLGMLLKEEIQLQKKDGIKSGMDAAIVRLMPSTDSSCIEVYEKLFSANGSQRAFSHFRK